MTAVALVTGGGSGLGEAVSRRLAGGGHLVVVADLDGGAARRVAFDVSGRAVVADVCKADDVDAMVDEAASLGPLKVLVLSAAIETRAPVVETSDSAWRAVLDTNLKGPFLCMRAAIPRMIDAGGGSIVALGSTLGQVVAPGYPAYCASKFALTNLCNRWRSSTPPTVSASTWSPHPPAPPVCSCGWRNRRTTRIP